MKKRMIALGLAVAFILSLGGVAAATGGTQADPLISRDYLEGAFLSELSNKISVWVQRLMQPAYQDAQSKLEQLAAGYLSSLGANDGAALPNGWFSTEEFVVGGGERNDTVSLAAGSNILWTDGSAVTDAALVDVTDGKEIAAGASLVAGHRYLTLGQTVIYVSSRTAHWATQGVWSTTSDGINVVELHFEDVPEDSWFYDAVYFVVTNNLFKGTGDTTFSPMMTMQRGMLTTVLHRMAGSPAVEYTPIFSDVPEGTWYTDGCIWAGVSGVASGTGNGKFLPGDEVGRQQIAVILYNYAKMMGYDVSQRGDLSAFADSGAVSSWAKDAVSWAVSVGILRGSDGKVMPANSASRAEVAVMLQRFDAWAKFQ